MAAQAGAASTRPGASGRKRSWLSDPPAFAKVVRVEPFAPPVRLEVFGLALRRSAARAENARAVQQLFAAHSKWGSLQVRLYLVDAFDGEVLVVGDRTQAVTAKSVTENAPGYRLDPNWCMGSGTKFAATINHDTFLTESAMRNNPRVVLARRELHLFHGRQLTYGEVGWGTLPRFTGRREWPSPSLKLAPGATPPSPPSGPRPSVVALPRLGGLGSCWGSIRFRSESRPGQVGHGRLVVGSLRCQWLTVVVSSLSCSVGARGMQHGTGRGRWTPGTGASSPSPRTGPGPPVSGQCAAQLAGRVAGRSPHSLGPVTS